MIGPPAPLSPGDDTRSTELTTRPQIPEPSEEPAPWPDPDRAVVTMIIADLTAGVDDVAMSDPGDGPSLRSRPVRPRITLPEPSTASMSVGSPPEEEGRSHRRVWTMAAVLLGCIALLGFAAVQLTGVVREGGVGAAGVTALPGGAAAGSPSPDRPSATVGSPSPDATSAPSAPIPGVAIGPPITTLGSRLIPSGVELKVAWTAPADGSRISRYDLQVAPDGGTYRAVDLARKTSRSATAAAIANHDYAFRLRARAGDGAPGPWVTSSVRLARHEESGPDVRATKGWKVARHPRYTGAGARYATARGAELSLAFDGTAVAIVGPRGPGRGRADVLVDGQRVGQFDSNGRTFRPVQLLLTVDGLVPGPHVLAVRVLGTSGRPMVAIDRFLILSEP